MTLGLKYSFQLLFVKYLQLSQSYAFQTRCNHVFGLGACLQPKKKLVSPVLATSLIMDVLANGMLQSSSLLSLLALVAVTSLFLGLSNTMQASDYMVPSTIY